MHFYESPGNKGEWLFWKVGRNGRHPSPLAPFWFCVPVFLITWMLRPNSRPTSWWGICGESCFVCLFVCFTKKKRRRKKDEEKKKRKKRKRKRQQQQQKQNSCLVTSGPTLLTCFFFKIISPKTPAHVNCTCKNHTWKPSETLHTANVST